MKCNRTFNKDSRRPKGMECGHIICLEDLQILIKSKPFKCPVDNKVCSKALEEFADDHIQMDFIDQAEIRCAEHSTITDVFCMTHCKPKCPKCVHQAGCLTKMLPDDLAEAKQRVLVEIDALYRNVPAATPEVRNKFERRYGNLLRDNFALSQQLLELQPKPFIMCECSNQAEVLRVSDLKAFCSKHGEKQMIEGSNVMKLREMEGTAICAAIENLFPSLLSKVNFYNIRPEILESLRNPPPSPKAMHDLGLSLIRLRDSKGSLELAPDEFSCPQCRRKYNKADVTLTVLGCREAFHAVCSECVREKSAEVSTVCPLDKMQFGVALPQLPTVSAQRQPAPTAQFTSPELSALGKSGFPSQPPGFPPQRFPPQPPGFPPQPPGFPPQPPGFPQQPPGFPQQPPPQPPGFPPQLPGFAPQQPSMAASGHFGQPMQPSYILPELAGLQGPGVGRGMPMGVPPPSGGQMGYPQQYPQPAPYNPGGFQSAVPPQPPRPVAVPGMGSPRHPPAINPGFPQPPVPKPMPQPPQKPVQPPVVKPPVMQPPPYTPPGPSPSMPAIAKVAGTALPPANFQPPEFVLERFPTVLPPLDVPASQRTQNQRGWSQTYGRNQVEAVIFTSSEPVKLFGISVAAPVERNQTSIVEFVNLYRGRDTKQQPAYSHRGRERIEGGNQMMADIRFSQPFPIAPYTPYSLKMKLSGEPAASYETYRGNPFDRPEFWFGLDGSLWEFEECTLVDPTEYLNGQNNLSGPMLRFLYRTN